MELDPLITIKLDGIPNYKVIEWNKEREKERETCLG